MHPNFVDIENEFVEIAAEAERLSNRLARIDPAGMPANTQDEWEATLVCASAVAKIFSGCERVMARLAAEIDRTPVVHADGWHAALLRRMANPFLDARGPIISKSCHEVLDRLRAFRHRERNTYGINLDFQIVVQRGHEAVAGFSMFRTEVDAFLHRLQPSTGQAGSRP